MRDAHSMRSLAHSFCSGSAAHGGALRCMGHAAQDVTHAVAEAHIGHGSPVVYMVYSE